MNPLSIVFFSLFILTLSASANENGCKALHKATKKEIIPPETVKFKDGLYADMAELSNFNWLEYMNWMQNKYGKESEAYKAVLPDTMTWRSSNRQLEEIYLRHPSFHNYPVVGVSYQQAEDYCAWRSDRVNEMLFARKNKIEYHYYKQDSTFSEIPQICSYRLPTEKEWENFASAPFSKKIIRKQKSNPIYNLKGITFTIKDANATDKETASTKAFWPNIYGQYNVIGNVAEMVSEKGKSKGGSWLHSLEESEVSNSINYTQPTKWLGFRCVCEVKQ